MSMYLSLSQLLFNSLYNASSVSPLIFASIFWRSVSMHCYYVLYCCNFTSEICFIIGEISGPRGGVYEDDSLPGHSAVSSRSLLVRQNMALHPRKLPVS
jgi:hypothetical protein